MKKRKTYFSERSISQIKGSDLTVVSSPANLVSRIFELQNDESFLLDFNIYPESSYSRFKVVQTTDLSRKTLKHGKYLSLRFPRSLSEVSRLRTTMMDELERELSKLQLQDEENIFVNGYSFSPVHTRNKQKRIVTLVDVLEGARLFSYSSQVSPITIDLYSNSKGVSIHGAKGIFSVPSRTQKASRYKIELSNLPFTRTNRSLPISLSIDSSSVLGEIPHKLFNKGFNLDTNRSNFSPIFFYPHHIAAYLYYIRNQIGQRNYEPLVMTPFLLPSKKLKLFYQKLLNNVVIRDETLIKRNKIRKLHLSEKSILLGRFISRNQFEEVFWNFERDGRLSQYDWI